MASYSLYEGSPVFGDLMGLTPDVEIGVYGGQDGAPTKMGPALLIQGQEESSSLQNGLLGSLDFGWMDSNVDLLQFLTGEEVAPLEPTSPVKTTMVEAEDVKSSITEADSAIAVEILKSVAEDTTKMLDSGSDPAINESLIGSPADAAVDWLDVLDVEVSQALESYAVADYNNGPILSPVTAEDVESILSSGSSSPSQEISGEWASILPMEVDSPDNSMQSPVFNEVNQSDLECLLLQVKCVPDDHNYQMLASPPATPDPVEGPSSGSSRPKPYSRKNTSRSSRKAPKDAKQLDRHERKKQQNKDAALRYRLKKKQESSVISSEVDVLEERNTQLKDNVEQMTREIKYLKNLLSDVYKAKGK